MTFLLKQYWKFRSKVNGIELLQDNLDLLMVKEDILNLNVNPDWV